MTERASPGRRQAEIVFGDAFVEYLETLGRAEQVDVLGEVLRLCDTPLGDHPLGNRGRHRLAGWNTVAVLRTQHRVIFSHRTLRGVPVIEVLCAGPRRDNAVYDMAAALIATGRLSDDEVTGIWLALMLIELVAESVGLDGWDYRPVAADPGIARSAVASGLLPADIAEVLSQDELLAAMKAGWEAGVADAGAAIIAALRTARAGAEAGDVTRILALRRRPRCSVVLPRAGQHCIRVEGHPGPHRARP